MRRIAMLAVAVAAAMVAGAVPALAADYYVDRDVVDTGPNLCTLAQPCDQIGDALDLADNSNSSADTIHVGRSTGAYPAVTIPSTPVTLLGGEFNAGLDGATTLIDGNTAIGVLLSTSSFSRTVNGFTIRGGDTGAPLCSLEGSGSSAITVQQNVFDEPSSQLDGFICLDDSPTITDNRILGNTGGGADPVQGIVVNGAGNPQITGNTVQGVDRALSLSGSTTSATVTNNNLFVRGVNVSPAAGIHLDGVAGDISRNTITMDPSTTQNQTDGILAENSSSGGTLRLSRNTIRGFQTSGPQGKGIELLTPDPVTLDSDIVANNDFGIDASSGNPQSLSLANLTFWANTIGSGDLRVGGSLDATVDSTILGLTGVGLTGSATCTSSFSRGPTSPTTCGPFATTATPSFVSQAARDYHLKDTGNGSLIESGNPAALPSGFFDIDDQLRAIDFDGDCNARRDIGADELPAAAIPGCAFGSGDFMAPDTSISATPLVRVRRRRAFVFFTLSSTEPGSTFRCSVDGGPFGPCTSPLGLILRRGGHNLSAVATDRAGNQDLSPARAVTTVLRKKGKHRAGGDSGKKGA